MSDSAHPPRCRSRADDTHWWIAYAKHSSVDGTSVLGGNGALRAVSIAAAALGAPEATQPQRPDKVERP
jgi:hypothetical protein